MKFKYGIIDADSILYQSALKFTDKRYKICTGLEFVSKRLAKEYIDNYELDRTIEEVIVESGTVEDTYVDFMDRIEYIKKEVLIEDSVIEVYTGSSDENFRYKVATILPYKGNRSESKEPPLLPKLKNKLIEEGILKRAPSGLEADDWVIARTIKLREEYSDDDVILCTIDKDAKQLKGYHYNFNHNELYYLSDKEANICFYTQLLTGDSTDNILGLFGVGPKSKLVKHLEELNSEQEMFNHVYHAYQQRFGLHSVKFCLENFRLLYMNRTDDTKGGKYKFYNLLAHNAEETV